MTQCPKCGSMNITEPRYRPRDTNHQQDALIYTCRVCGYSKERPTKDSQDGTTSSFCSVFRA